MKNSAQHRQSERLLVVMPSWVGDAVMATPTLRALRKLYPQATIAALACAAVVPILDGCPWIDRIIPAGSRKGGVFSVARLLSAGKYDTAVLLPNSFRSALMVMMAGVRHRVGYDRDHRGFLLTDRLVPLRRLGAFVPVPTLDYYLGLARYLGAEDIDPAMQLFTQPQHEAEIERLFAEQGYIAGKKQLVVMTPGASYGDAKMWLPQRFAAVADRCVRQLDAVVAVTGAAKERQVIDNVVAHATEPILDLSRLGVDLIRFKSVVKRSSLVITNDTGPRHIAAAMGVPVVSIFGPTDPAWTKIDHKDERQVMVSVECGPCQLKKCPLDHRCMELIEADMVFEEAAQLLADRGAMAPFKDRT